MISSMGMARNDLQMVIRIEVIGRTEPLTVKARTLGKMARSMRDSGKTVSKMVGIKRTTDGIKTKGYWSYGEFMHGTDQLDGEKEAHLNISFSPQLL